MGAAYGTAKAGISIAGVGTFKPELIMKVPRLPLSALIHQSLIPVVMSGIIAVYGLVMAVLIAGSLNPLDDYSLYKYSPPSLPSFPRARQLTRQWNNTSIIRAVCWINWPGSRILHRNRRRPGCPELSPSTEDFRGLGAYIDFCRGVGVIWVDCGVDIEYTSWTSAMLVPSLQFISVISL